VTQLREYFVLLKSSFRSGKLNSVQTVDGRSPIYPEGNGDDFIYDVRAADINAIFSI